MEPCPQCHRIDQVQKVSALVSGGTLFGTASSGASVYTASSLAQHLSLPEAPQVIRPGKGSAVLLVISGVLAFILLGIASSTSRGLPYYQSNWNFAIGVIAFTAIVFFSRFSAQRKAQQQEQALAKWHQMRERWDRAYYCHRCDIVYIDGEPRYVPARDFHTLLKS
jgi:hypothetical protein